jgi:hypothetical protein
MPSNGARGFVMSWNFNPSYRPCPALQRVLSEIPGPFMKPSLFAHPFASYCQKVLIALYENRY